MPRRRHPSRPLARVLAPLTLALIAATTARAARDLQPSSGAASAAVAAVAAPAAPRTGAASPLSSSSSSSPSFRRLHLFVPDDDLYSRPPSSSSSDTPGLNYTILLPSKVEQDVPLVFLLNGANVDQSSYTRLASSLANKGYPVALSDAWREVPAPLRQATPPLTAAEAGRRARNGCPDPRAAVLGGNADALGRFLRAVDEAEAAAGDGKGGTAGLATPFLRLRQRGVVLLGHSFGGSVASLLLGGRCRPPPVSSNGTAAPSFSEFSFLCGGWQPLPRDLALLRGAVLLEGYPSSPGRAAGSTFSPAALDLSARREAGERAGERAGGGNGNGKPAKPAVPFVLFLQGEANARVRAAYAASAAAAKDGTCVAYARFRGLNHYLGTDWVEPSKAGGGGSGEAGGSNSTSSSSSSSSSSSRQVTPCGQPASGDPPTFAVTREVQDRGTANIAALVDDVIKAHGGGGGSQAAQEASAAAKALAAAKAATARGAARGTPAGSSSSSSSNGKVAPGDMLELLHAGGGCRFGA